MPTNWVQLSSTFYQNKRANWNLLYDPVVADWYFEDASVAGQGKLYLNDLYNNPILPFSPLIRTYTVGASGTSAQFTTIQSAIDAALADGHTNASTNPAVVLVYPKGSQYAEDLTLYDGIHIVGYLNGLEKTYAVAISGQLTYSPVSNSGYDSACDVHLVGLYISAGSGKNCVKLTGANQGRIYITNCYLSKTGASDSTILMNGNATSIIEAFNIDGNVAVSAAGATIYDISAGNLMINNMAFISSTSAGKIISCGATGVVRANYVVSNCTAADAITVAAGGNVTLSNSLITNAQANSNGANIAAGGTMTALNVLWNVPAGTGFSIKGVLGSVFIYVYNAFVANVKISAAIGAGIVPLATAPVPT